MSLLLNEEYARLFIHHAHTDELRFSIYQLRAGYLHHVKDGIGDRVVSLDTSILNTVSFRAAGWTINPADTKRAYSPPIPTAVATNYFQLQYRGTTAQDTIVTPIDETVGIVTGHGGSDETTLGPGIESHQRRKRREMLHEDDSSDLSDESEDDQESKTAAQSIHFSKMPVRHRSGSSPMRPSRLHNEVKEEEVPSQTAFPPLPTTTTKPQAHARRGSLGAVEHIKQRVRRDTATSSEWSSENEHDTWHGRRQRVAARSVKSNPALPQVIHEEEQKPIESDLEDDNISQASDLSDFDADLQMDLAAFPGVEALSGRPPVNTPPIAPLSTKPAFKLAKDAPELPRLPPGRPISYVQPISLLSMAFKSQGSSGESPFQRFAQLSGKGDPNPFYIRIFAPFSSSPTTPFEVSVRRIGQDGGTVTVAELIGLSLWRYEEEKNTPAISDKDRSVNRWSLRMVEDEEVDYDFPALGQARPVTDFTSNNNRPVRGRSREKPWDEFALVRATDEQYSENVKTMPQYEIAKIASAKSPLGQNSEKTATPQAANTAQAIENTQLQATATRPVLPSFVTERNMSVVPAYMRKDSSAAALVGAPAHTEPAATPRTGIAKTITVHFMDPLSFQSSNFTIETTSDTYLAEIYSTACAQLKIDKAQHVLKVQGTQTVVPHDRTVEALGEHSHLDMLRRRFVGLGDPDCTGPGSPQSQSPNAPLILPGSGSPAKARRKGAFTGVLTSAGKTGMLANEASAMLLPTLSPSTRQYHVIRRQPLSFAPSNPRILAREGEYVYIMPGTANDMLPSTTHAAATKKTSRVHLTSIVGCKISRKHPKMIRMLVYREKETKRYDFECISKEEALDALADIRRGVDKFGLVDDL